MSPVGAKAWWRMGSGMLEGVMELRQLRHFLEVGETGSITAAARNLHLTQPALSRQIKALEEELDAALLERGAHSVTLTPAGEILIFEGKKLIKIADALVEKVRAGANAEHLRVGYSPSLAGEFLAVAVGRFTQIHPKARISLADCSSSEMRTGLTEGKLDLIVGTPCANPNEAVRWVDLREYGWRLAIPSGHPLAKKRTIAPEDLDGERLLLFERVHYPDYWDRITGYFRDHNIQAKVAGEFDGVTSLVAAVEANLGIALLAESSPVPHGHHRHLVIRRLTREPPRIRVSAGLPPGTAASAKLLSFIEELKQAAKSG